MTTMCSTTVAKVTGRIFLSLQAPQGRPWFWTVTARDYRSAVADIQRHVKQQWQISKRSG
jgi:hypothetical protein